MATYLLNYNPERWEWKNIELAIKEINETGQYIDSWSCGNRKNIEVGDRVFIIKLGAEPRGIIASGWVHNGWYQDIHWNEEKVRANKLANYIDVDFEVLVNPKYNVLPYEKLQKGKLKNMLWSNQSSGVVIPNDVATELEKIWTNYVSMKINQVERQDVNQEEIVNADRYCEGAVTTIAVNRFERNAFARSACIQTYGYKCYACGINLEDIYGERAKDFIHIHHTVPLAKVRKEYYVDPIKDLKPLCPNCHAVLHRYKPALTIDELKQIIKTK